jgi:cytochrome d ubiquinol oxidase subunit II
MYDGTFYAKFLGLLPLRAAGGRGVASMLLMHGAAWLSLKAEGVVGRRARAIGTVPAWSPWRLTRWPGCGWRSGRRLRLVGEVVTDGPSNPLYSEVARGGSWLTPMPRGPGSRSPRHGLSSAWRMAMRGLRAGARSRRCCGRSSASSG